MSTEQAPRTAATSTWQAARTVLLASPRSFCAGVERAIAMVEAAVGRAAGPVYVRKQIVHNTYVVAQLEARGAVFVDELDQVPAGATVVFSAHGVAPAVWDQARQWGLNVIDATCPLVSKVHAEARRFAARGDTVVLIGHAGHEEVDGTLGQALRERLPLLSEPPSEDICYATTNRQNAVRALLDECDLLLVVGSTNSSNSLRLVELAARHGVAAHLIDGPSDIEDAWLKDAGTIAVTAGASAPPILVDRVLAHVAKSGPITVAERRVTTENVRFAAPSKDGAR